ncbi:MAG: Tol-Pal system protein TolB [Alphaproteobacteria bacterium]|nr:Tol-Pal system protein TolB [Alphaproteobacteria bacterium]
MFSFTKKMFLCLMMVFVVFADCSDRVVVNVDRGVMKPINIALHMQDGTHSMKELMLRVIRNDLQGCYLFKAIPNGAFMQNLQGANQIPNFSLWKAINTQYLVNSEAHMEGGVLQVKMVLYDVLAQSKISEYTLKGNAKEWRKMAHMLANKIYERIIGENGYFDTKILYVATQRAAHGRKIHRLAIMDQDGENHRYLTNGNTMVLTPRLSPDGSEFCFFAYREKKVNGRRIPLDACIYRYEFGNSRTHLLIKTQGMSYAPRYSPDGTSLIFSMTKHGSSSIYRYDIVTRKIIRLTHGKCIDTSPCYSPDGKFIVFNSDRGGSQQLYVMNSDGSNVRRLSFGHYRYATPVWSPRGDWIAFTCFNRDGFFIGVIHPDGTGERRVASGYLVESPSWSPNGREILYSSRDALGREKIYRVDITGYNKHEVATPLSAIDPEWSANLGIN